LQSIFLFNGCITRQAEIESWKNGPKEMVFVWNDETGKHTGRRKQSSNRIKGKTIYLGSLEANQE
jgi:hypothetical protein